MKYEVSVVGKFSSAHALREYRGRCENLHGHNWNVKVSFIGTKLNKIGILVDFKDIKKYLDGILNALDHKYLNETTPFDKINPTAENIASYIFKELKNAFKTGGVKIKEVEVWESDSTSAKVYE